MSSRFGVPLVAVAHGSRDPRSAATVQALAGVVRALAPELDVRVAFLDLSAPRLPDVLAAVHADGYAEAVVVPLLLGRAYHARVDIPGAVHAATARQPRLSVRIADVLGPDDRLAKTALRRLVAAGAELADPGLGVVLAGAGSSHAPANAAVARVARQWRRATRWAASTAAFAAAAEPDVTTAIERLRAAGARRIAVGSWFLAPGLLPDRIAQQTLATAPTAVLADPLGADPAVAEVILTRYTEAVAPTATHRAS